MADRAGRREGWLWGVLLALALLGAVIGIAQWVERGGTEDAPEPLRLGDPGMPLGDPLDPLPSPDLPADFVPDLPAVPTLPPGARARTPPARDREGEQTEDGRLGDLAAEMRLVGEARALAATDPSGALQLLDQHRARFPRGALREEREVYAIEALVGIAHTDEAERRYHEFRADFPESTFLARLERAMN